MAHGALLLSDVSANHLDAQQWDTLYRFVAERGGSVILVAGNSTTSVEMISNPLIIDLLPFRGGATHPAWRVWPGDQPLFRMAPAPGGGSDALSLADNPAAAQERWADSFNAGLLNYNLGLRVPRKTTAGNERPGVAAKVAWAEFWQAVQNTSDEDLNAARWTSKEAVLGYQAALEQAIAE